MITVKMLAATCIGGVMMGATPALPLSGQLADDPILAVIDLAPVLDRHRDLGCDAAADHGGRVGPVEQTEGNAHVGVVDVNIVATCPGESARCTTRAGVAPSFPPNTP